jgi:3-hydroxybutyryl-CoA dehydrogenase
VTGTPEKHGIAAVGAGRMGQGIALAFAYCGYSVSLIDLKPRPAEEFARLEATARGNLRRDLEFLFSVNALGGGAVDDYLQRVRNVDASLAAQAIADTQVIFEAVPETLEAKRTALASICQSAREEALIASTTSTFDANILAELVTRPERFMNAHWLNPAHLMPLVEVSPCKVTAPAHLERLLELLRSAGKVPVVCASSPGYIVPRIQALAMNEAARMVEEGIASAQDIDTAVRVGFGLRFAVLGLLEFIDWGGGDILYHASRNLAANLDPERFAAPPIIEQNMHEGRRGLRDGAGFFDYRGQDVESYRNARLTAFVALLRHLNLMPRSQASRATGEPAAGRDK